MGLPQLTGIRWLHIFKLRGGKELWKSLHRDDMTADEILPIAMAVHFLSMEFPITMRSKREKGIRIEEGKSGLERLYGPGPGKMPGNQ